MIKCHSCGYEENNEDGEWPKTVVRVDVGQRDPLSGMVRLEPTIYEARVCRKCGTIKITEIDTPIKGEFSN